MHRQNDITGCAEPLNDPRAFGLFRVTYSVKETLTLLSIGRTTFYELVERGDLKITKLGRKSLIYAIDPAAFLAQLREPTDKDQVNGTSQRGGTPNRT